MHLVYSYIEIRHIHIQLDLVNRFQARFVILTIMYVLFLGFAAIVNSLKTSNKCDKMIKFRKSLLNYRAL